jgi:hypothetical protein
MGIDKLRMMTSAPPKKSFFDELNADLRRSVEERIYTCSFQYRDSEQIEALTPRSQVRIKTRPNIEPYFFLELNYHAPGGKLEPQTVIELNPNKFQMGFHGVSELLDRIVFLKDGLKITRVDLNAEIEEVPVQYFRDAVRYPQKRKAGDIGEWRKRAIETLYIGRSPSRIRIYDKIQELKYNGVDVSAFPAVLTRIEWETRQGRWNRLPHSNGAEVTYFSDLPNLLRFQPFAKMQFLEAVPAYDFENDTQDSIRRLVFHTLAAKQGAHAAAAILNKNRNFSRDYRDLLLLNEEIRNQLQASYLDTTRRFFNDQGADVRYIYGASLVVPEPHSVERFDFKIVDESRIPREFLKPNEKALFNRVTQLGWDAQIPGVLVIDHLFDTNPPRKHHGKHQWKQPKTPT